MLVEIGATGNELASWLMVSSTPSVTAKTLRNEATRSVKGAPSNTMGACMKLLEKALLLTADPGVVFKLALGGGGSAMPCGLVLPVASAKLKEGDWELLVRLAAASN